jgi:tetratricopeptide (TPR) repeat protein
VAAFIDSFGVSLDEMQRQIDSYARRSRYTVIEFPEVTYDGGLTEEPLALAEELYLLGDLAVELGEREAAYDYFEQFDELEITSPLTDKVASRRAIAHIHDDQVADGDAIIEALAAANPADADILADIAHYAYDRYTYALTNREPGQQRHLDRAIAFGERAIAGNPFDLEARFYLGLAYESNGELQEAVDSLLAFYDVNPSVAVLNMNLARVLIKGRQKDLALYLLSRVYSSAHSEDERTRIRAIQQQIEAEDFDIDTVDQIL